MKRQKSIFGKPNENYLSVIFKILLFVEGLEWNVCYANSTYVWHRESLFFTYKFIYQQKSAQKSQTKFGIICDFIKSVATFQIIFKSLLEFTFEESHPD